MEESNYCERVINIEESTYSEHVINKEENSYSEHGRKHVRLTGLLNP